MSNQQPKFIPVNEPGVNNVPSNAVSYIRDVQLFSLLSKQASESREQTIDRMYQKLKKYFGKSRVLHETSSDPIYLISVSDISEKMVRKWLKAKLKYNEGSYEFQKITPPRNVRLMFHIDMENAKINIDFRGFYLQPNEVRQ